MPKDFANTFYSTVPTLSSSLNSPTSNNKAESNALSLRTDQCSNSSTLGFSETLVVIDPSVDAYQILANGVVENVSVVILTSDCDGINQITQILQRHPQITDVHIVSHGSPGCLYLGNSQLNLETIERYSCDLQSWFSSADSSLILYGCSVAADDAGAEFVEKLHQLTGANVAASTKLIGSNAKGGDWELDFITNGIKSSSAFQQAVMKDYASTFAVGDLDPTFDGDGLVDGIDGDIAALQPNGKIVLFGGNRISRYNSNGSLDFDTRFTIDFSDFLIQPDGKILVAGYRNVGVSSTNSVLALKRFNSDGSDDTSFGNNGLSTSQYGIPQSLLGSFSKIVSIALQSDGKILALTNQSVLLRYNNDGSPESVLSNIPGNIPSGAYLAANKLIALQPDGKIVVAGTSTSGIYFLTRYYNNGIRDDNFGNQGIVTTNVSPSIAASDISTSSGRFNRIILQPDGKIIVGGNQNNKFALQRYNSDGSLDKSFGVDGTLYALGSANQITFIPDGTKVRSIALQADGKILISLEIYDEFRRIGLTLARLNNNGSLDESFGNGGTIEQIGNIKEVGDIAIQPDGKALLTGYSSDFHTGIARITLTQTPTEISLSGASIAENQPGNTTIGSFTTTDPDVGEIHTYSLVTGAGSTDNNAFTIEGNVLKAKQPFDFETKNSYSIRIQTKDVLGATFEKQFTISVSDVNEIGSGGTGSGGTGGTGTGGTGSGGTQIDFIGGVGNDTIAGNNLDNKIYGNAGNDFLSGLGGNDIIIGGSGNDTLLGGDGNDRLSGREGVDVLTGGSGNDRFAFLNPTGAFNKKMMGIDTITDFTHGVDKIELYRKTFTSKHLSFAKVKNITQAKKSKATLTYIQKTGALFYNQNGTKTGFGIGGQFADLANGLLISNTDFSLIK
jgi:uncharacterized delta-60 repeat protein